ncbi:hypothetical protein C6P40_003634 [Pichia californica]|uniref:Uncharacterized protein n=1 Tax=Pichia californica TaxID=460514 RepID=A0A9P6WGX7_9ASCO|nr:hypothetical protein C6P42_003360 [[Candida] californica]KAG0686651.1 hypothetical protein C6P40_003634 [[Candida] californica]
MAIGKRPAEEFEDTPNISVSPFTIHDRISFKLFLEKINNEIGRKIYTSTDELLSLGIVLNIETGYMIHVGSTFNIKCNFSFSLTTNVNQILNNIIEKCDFKNEVTFSSTLVKLWIKNLYEDNNIDVVMNRRRPHFIITYQTALKGGEKFLNKRNKLGNMYLYSEPDPLIPVYNSYQCDICLKSTCNLKSTMSHINEFHTFSKDFKSMDFISASYCQPISSGVITVLMSERFIEIEKKINRDFLKSIPPYFIPQLIPPMLENDHQNDSGYTISEISEFDEMFNFNYIVKFLNKLQIKDFNYYLDYCKLDTRYRKMEEFLTKLLFNIIVFETRKYSYDNTLTTHRNKSLKFYMSSAQNPSFIFSKISNFATVLNYSKNISKALIILHASFNLNRKKMDIYCEEPQYKVCFTHSQKTLLKKTFSYIFAHYKSRKIIMFNIDTTKSASAVNQNLLKKDLQFWNNLKTFFINISLQKKGKYTPLQSMFSFSIASFDYINKRLNFHRPSRRSKIFKSLLYIIRLSFLSVVNHQNDEYYNALITNATMDGEIRQIMEKLYYPTMYYFLKRKKFILQPFFNPEKYTYVHSVFFIDKFVGCKILGLHSINMMIEKTIDYISTEYMYIKRFSEIKCDFEDFDLINKIINENKEKKIIIREDSCNFITSMLSRDFKRSISGITCLLIGYLVLTNRPLSLFKDYLEIPNSAFEFTNDLLKISTDAFTITVQDKYLIRCFKYYQVIRIFLFRIDSKLDNKKFFFNLNYVKGSTFLDLMGCKYTFYRHLSTFLKLCHDKNDSKGYEFSKPWLDLVKSALRERSEGYLIINLKLIAIDNQKYSDNNNLNLDQDNVDPRSYISTKDAINLKDIIESGFLDYQFSEDKDKLNYSQHVDETDQFSTPNIPIESDDNDDYGNDNNKERDYDTMIDMIKSRLNPTSRKRLKL